ncbi:hypothetical protein CAPTEDRAFT_199219, partial [Capitella teleta]
TGREQHVLVETKHWMEMLNVIIQFHKYNICNNVTQCTDITLGETSILHLNILSPGIGHLYKKYTFTSENPSQFVQLNVTLLQYHGMQMHPCRFAGLLLVPIPNSLSYNSTICHEIPAPNTMLVPSEVVYGSMLEKVELYVYSYQGFGSLQLNAVVSTTEVASIADPCLLPLRDLEGQLLLNNSRVLQDSNLVIENSSVTFKHPKFSLTALLVDEEIYPRTIELKMKDNQLAIMDTYTQHSSEVRHCNVHVFMVSKPVL